MTYLGYVRAVEGDHSDTVAEERCVDVHWSLVAQVNGRRTRRNTHYLRGTARCWNTKSRKCEILYCYIVDRQKRCKLQGGLGGSPLEIKNWAIECHATTDSTFMFSLRIILACAVSWQRIHPVLNCNFFAFLAGVCMTCELRCFIYRWGHDWIGSIRTEALDLKSISRRIWKALKQDEKKKLVPN